MSDFFSDFQISDMKIFVILPRVPYPLEKGDKLRAFHILKHLKKNNEIFLFAVTEDEIHQEAYKKIDEIAHHIEIFPISKLKIAKNLLRALFSDKPFQVAYYYDQKIKKRIDNLVDDFRPDHLFCQLVRMAEYAKDINVSKTLDYIDAISINMKHRNKSDSIFLAPIFNMEYKRLARYERDIAKIFNAKIITSEIDKNAISKQANDIEVIPNGIDTLFYYPSIQKKEFELLFTGNMSYEFNIVAARYIAIKVLPLLIKEYPNIKLVIAGANPSKQVLSLQNKNVEVTGWVEDLRDVYNRASIFIAPMQSGTGIQNKLLEAMAMQLPAISSSLSNNAIGAENNKQIIIADTPDECAQAIRRFLSDKEFADYIAEEGRKYVEANFSWPRAAQKIEKLMLEHI